MKIIISLWLYKGFGNTRSHSEYGSETNPCRWYCESGRVGAARILFNQTTPDGCGLGK